MLTDKQFSFIQTYLPPKRRPGMEYREFLDAIVFVLTTGCQWRRLPKDYGNWHTVYTRFKRWSEKGIMQKDNWKFLERGIIDCSIIMIDSTVVRYINVLQEHRKKKGLKVSEEVKADSQRKFMQYLLMKQQS